MIGSRRTDPYDVPLDGFVFAIRPEPSAGARAPGYAAIRRPAILAVLGTLLARETPPAA